MPDAATDSGATPLATGCLELEGSYSGNDELVYDLAWSPVADLVATGGTGWLRLFHVDPDRPEPILVDAFWSDTRFNSLQWSADGRALIAPSGTRILIFPVDDNGSLGTPVEGPQLPAELQRAGLSPDQTALLTCDRDGNTTLHRLDLAAATVEPLVTLPVHSRCTRVAFSPSGRLAMSVGLEGLVALYRVDTAAGTITLAETIQAAEETGEAIFAATDDVGVAGSFGTDNELWTLDIDPESATFEIAMTHTGHASGVSALAFDHTHSRLLTGGHDHSMHLWQVLDGGTALARSYDHPDDGVGVHSARWSRDDSLVARTASNVDRVDIFSVRACASP